MIKIGPRRNGKYDYITNHEDTKNLSENYLHEGPGLRWI